MTAYYNENDDYAAAWLENLIAAGHIALGVVDRRPIQDVEAFELMEFTQCHFFAGIGVWSHALRRAGWSDDRPIWTGSCPCQPFSAAGKQKGFEDERHLWPIWSRLVEQCKPAVVVGEQVDKALDWIDLVSSDLEAQSYAFGAAIISAAGFEGAHIRHRNYFVGLADSFKPRLERHSGNVNDRQKSGRINENEAGSTTESLQPSRLDNLISDGRRARWNRDNSEYVGEQLDTASNDGRLADDQTKRCEGQSIRGDGKSTVGQSNSRNGISTVNAEVGSTGTPLLGRASVDWLYGRDGKWRPVEPSTFPLAHAVPSRVGRLRAYGNALDAETATQFCQVVREICDGI